MKALIDADILRFEISYGAEVGWKAITNTDDIPPFDYVKKMFDERIETIMRTVDANDATLYLSSGRAFRYDIAKTIPYKSTRTSIKPFHFYNLTAYINSIGGKTITDIEADDAIGIDHYKSDGETIVCSRDKDLRQLKGMSFSWELGRQPQYGPELISKEGYLKLIRHEGKSPKLMGTGLSFFYAQLLMGDRVDTVPGCKGIGPVETYTLLNERSSEEQLASVTKAYQETYGADWEDMITEQGQLLWIIRRVDQNQKPIMWQLGMTE